QTPVTDTWFQHLNEPLPSGGGVLTIGNDARYRPWDDDRLIPPAHTIFGTSTLHGHSRVVNMRFDAPALPGDARHFTFRLLPPRVYRDDWSLDGAELSAARSHGAGGESKKVRIDDARCDGP